MTDASQNPATVNEKNSLKTSGSEHASFLVEEKEKVLKWRNRLESALKIYRPYYDVIKRARHFYLGAKENGGVPLLGEPLKAGASFFWSSIETQKPFLYFKQPKPYLERLNKYTTPSEQVAAKILERALEWNLKQFDFDSVVKYARNDYLIFGSGILWESYEADFETVEVLGSEEPLEIKTGEKVITRYVDPLDFVADTSQNGIFENISWVARCIHMSKEKIKSFFGADMFDRLVQKGILSLTGEEDFVLDVYEIWDKEEKKVYWFSFEVEDFFLCEKSDPLGLSGFFPMPKPIFASMTNDSLIPVSDFQMIEGLLEEFSGVTERMRLLMQAIKVSGVYDASFSRISDIFDKDVTLIGLHDFERLKEMGGIRGAIDFIPIDQYIKALEVLIARKESLKQEIFCITGVSDIMRGSSDKVETATAVEKKTNFGTLRNQDRQNDMHRFIMDCYQIKAELICEQFSPATLERFINLQEGYDYQVIQEAIGILKTGKMRDMILSIETDAFFDQEKKTKDAVFAIETISKMLSNGVAVVAQEPLLLPLYRQMISKVVSTLQGARHFENVIDQTFLKIEDALKKEQQTSDLMEASLLQKQMQNKSGELDDLKYQIEKQELFVKLKDLLFKERELNFKNKKAELDFQKAVLRHKQEGVYLPTPVPKENPVYPPKEAVIGAERLKRYMLKEKTKVTPSTLKRAMKRPNKLSLQTLSLPKKEDK
ncbi:MAG: hypothetical protein J6V53_04115 [Alphaproteobacteria bacterium]|nr:hypothetical protein [Alphaproteobacteria bacterium]